MRTFRPLFEHYVHKDDLQQRRALRSTTLAIRKESDDAFEDYLSLMSRNGTYGGEPELVAFCQVYDQDVTVHLPQIQNFDRDSILYRNEHRDGHEAVTPLHICYGGDEVTRAHYDSARSKDGSTPKSHNSPLLRPQDPRRDTPSGTVSPIPGTLWTTRAIRSSRSDLSSELVQDILQRGKKDVESALDLLNDKSHRARSPSVSSSHRSSSSKRSLEDDGDQPRTSKRADRRKSTRRRADLGSATRETERLHVESPTADTPTSTQDTEYSSSTPDPDHVRGDLDADTPESPPPRDGIGGRRAPSPRPIAIPRTNLPTRSSATVATKPAKPAKAAGPARLMSVTERPRSTLRT